jgi:drug/metabolite transporter (DMT)-like permease
MGAAGLALVAAALAALGAALQQRAAIETPATSSAQFCGAVWRNRAWLAGAIAHLLAWVAQAAALARGQLFVVQPVMSLQVVLALPLGVLIAHQHVGRKDTLAAVAVAAGLVVFLAVSRPAAGRADAPAVEWLVAALAVSAVVVLLATIGSTTRALSSKAALFGAASGTVFAFQAAVMKVFVGLRGGGLGVVLSSWTTYAMIASALAGFALTQISLQAGTLAAAVGSANAANPVASILLGRTLFDEKPARTAAGTVVALVSLGVMLAGLVALARGDSRGEEG